MKKKHLIIVGTIIISAIVILGLYQTFALSGDITKDTSGYYNVTVSSGTTVNVPANSSKTVYYKLTNTNKGTVKYGVGYSGSNITVKYYHDTQDPVTGTVDYRKTKFIKLYVENTGTTTTTVTLSTILGYEKGGDLIVPSGYTLVNEKKTLSSKEVLQRLDLSYSEETPNFTKTSIEDGTNGIYSAEDDLGTSYYFRGNVTNNYVKFANYYWRIIRINGDGTIIMIYAGTSAHANGYNDSSANNMSIGTSAFNSSNNDNTYVGYMYGTKGASTYANTHSNTTNSTIKTELDSWYDTNIVNTGNEKYIADAIYCNDRSLSSGTGIGKTKTTYTAQTRMSNGKPTLKCANNSDKFTKSTTIGNGKLTKMMGLITSDEVMYAGEKYGVTNKEYYLYSGKYYWTMTPYSYSIGVARAGSVNGYGSLSYFRVNDDFPVRPVVSLKSDAISGGSGTAESPFFVGS